MRVRPFAFLACSLASPIACSDEGSTASPSTATGAEPTPAASATMPGSAGAGPSSPGPGKTADQGGDGGGSTISPGATRPSPGSGGARPGADSNSGGDATSSGGTREVPGGGAAGAMSEAGAGASSGAGATASMGGAAGEGTGGDPGAGASDPGGDGGSLAGGAPSMDGGNPNRICTKGKCYYLNGINVAWNQWTQDLTDYDADAFESMFATLEASGGNAIRWWWFIDGQNQVTFAGNEAEPLSQNVFDNLDQAFDAAASHGVLIMPVFLSFDIEGVREFLVTDAAATDAFVQNVVAPLVERYDDHPGLGLWEIMNEGDWLLQSEMGNISLSDYQRFHAKMAAGIHAAAPEALVTTGSASFKYLEGDQNILSDATLQAAAGGDPLAHLDVYQTHYYGWMHGDGWSYEPWIRTSTEWQGDGKPILIGEFPCRGEPGRWSSSEMHLESVNQGYAGTFCWAYFDNRADDEGTWNDAEPSIEAIAAQIPNAITGE